MTFNWQMALKGRFLFRLPLVLTALTAFWIFPALAGARVVKVGVYENAPKVFTAESGKPAGIFIEIIEAIAEQEGWDLKYVHGTWGESLDRLQNGEIDLMPDVAYSTQRENIFAFPKEPVLSDWFQVYARKGSGIKSIVDLAGKRVMVLERSVQQAAFEELTKGFAFSSTLIALPDYHTIFQQVSAGKADAAITNRFYGMVHANKFKLEDTAIIFNPTKLFFAFTKPGDAALMKAVDAGIRQMKEDPESKYYQALKRWTSEKFEFTLPVWMKVFGLVAGTALLMSLMGVVVLRSQVNKRTHQLRKINREMEARIEQRTAELATAMEKAQVADRLKSAFLATMSHELRTPLNSIIGFTGILLQKLAGPLNEEQEKQMRMVQTSARHLLDLINDVLDISKIEAGQLDLSYGTFELRGSIQKTVDLVSPLAAKKGLDIELELAQDLGLVKSDQRRLEQIILNLLNNALKFTEQGHVHIACRSDDDHYLLSISDSGIGIQPEELSDLFQPFHQIDTGLSRKHEGTGLGLSICKKLMDLMGGTIDVQSKWGQGSTFFIRFPKGVSQEDS